MLEELKDPSPCSACINLMSIHKSQAPEQVYEIKTAIECIKQRPIDIFEISPILGEVVIRVR